MADDIAAKLKTMLDNPEIIKLIGSMAQNTNTPDTGSVESAPADSTQGSDQMISTIKNAIDTLGGGNDNRITLLSALKPYMRQSRAGQIDTAIRVLKISRLSGLFKEL